MKPSREKLLGIGLAGIELLIIGLIAFWLIRAFIAFTNPESNWAPVSAAEGTALLPQESVTTVNLSFDPFHRNQAQIVEIEPQPGLDAPETTLDLRMVGRRFGENGSAVIETPDGGQKNYKIGDEILDGVTLESVAAGYVVISQRGRLERLTFEESEETGLRAAPDNSALAAPALDPESLLSAIKLAPFVKEGQLEGFKVSSKDPNYDLSQIGLRSGDVITRIGDTDLRAGLPDLEALSREFSKGTGVRVNLLRNNQTMTIELKL